MSLIVIYAHKCLCGKVGQQYRAVKRYARENGIEVAVHITHKNRERFEEHIKHLLKLDAVTGVYEAVIVVDGQPERLSEWNISQ